MPYSFGTRPAQRSPEGRLFKIGQCLSLACPLFAEPAGLGLASLNQIVVDVSGKLSMLLNHVIPWYIAAGINKRSFDKLAYEQAPKGRIAFGDGPAVPGESVRGKIGRMMAGVLPTPPTDFLDSFVQSYEQVSFVL